MTVAPAPEVAATVAGAPVSAAEVERRLAQVRSAGFGARLPQPHTAEGRNARRWVVQLLCAERVVDAALAEHGIARTGRRADLSVTRALALGGVAAAVWAVRPELAELVDRWAVQPDVGEIRSYYDRNRDRYGTSEFSEVRNEIETELRSAARDRAFCAWLDTAMARDVRLAAGCEHPADPRHADATHHH